MIHFLTIGTLLGLSAGFAPGPLLTLVISETLQHDVKSGIKVALAPILTDAPIILLTLFILSRLSHFQALLGVISLAGSVFILFLAKESFQADQIDLALNPEKPKSLIKGILANALSPHPYLFWLSVGAPAMTRAMSQNNIAPLAFIGSFYVFLIGSKITLALVAGKSKSFLTGRAYKVIMRFLGAALCVLSIAFFREGLDLLGIL
jgi:threonine/homoserine/homoserine lactone efflux protein